MTVDNSVQKYYKKIQIQIDTEDREFLNTFNPINEKHRPQKNLQPCPFEGNLKNAKVILLLANPGFIPTDKPNASDVSDHDRDGFDDWGLWGLSSKTKSSMHGWWRKRLKSFVRNIDSEEEWRQLSLKVASVQAVPWASEQFHEINGLPSKEIIANLVKELSDEKYFVIMRQRSYWSEILMNRSKEQIMLTKNPRCSYLSEGNMGSVDFKKLYSLLT